MGLWVFGYGSLLWDPGFVPAETQRAVLLGYDRSFCMLSIHHRGTVERPGLVPALDAAEGARCTGLAFRVAEDEEDAVLAYLRERELVSAAYLEQHVTLGLADGREVEALAYIVDRDHPQYIREPLEDQAHRIAGAVGGRGPNPDYLDRTVEHLRQMEIKDPDLEWLAERVRSLSPSRHS